jgi:hypothetical protein
MPRRPEFKSSSADMVEYVLLFLGYVTNTGERCYLHGFGYTEVRLR